MLRAWNGRQFRWKVTAISGNLCSLTCDNPVLASSYGVGELRRSTRGAHRFGRRELRRRRVDGDAAPPVVAPRVLRDRGGVGLRGQRAVGGRRGQDGGLVDLLAVSGPPG